MSTLFSLVGFCVQLVVIFSSIALIIDTHEYLCSQDTADEPDATLPMTTPVISITDSDKAVWSKFQALSREQRMVIINWARPQFGHVGINNIIQVRAAWHEFNNPESCADESVLADIA